MTYSDIKKELRRIGISFCSTSADTPWTETEDAAIHLEGDYEGIHVSIGSGYYSVVREDNDGTFIFIDGEGDLKAEINEARNT
jgi:hypothetical protein